MNYVSAQEVRDNAHPEYGRESSLHSSQSAASTCLSSDIITVLLPFFHHCHHLHHHYDDDYDHHHHYDYHDHCYHYNSYSLQLIGMVQTKLFLSVQSSDCDHHVVQEHHQDEDQNHPWSFFYECCLFRPPAFRCMYLLQ